MIKIETLNGPGTVMRSGEESALFPGMLIDLGELDTVVCDAGFCYTVEEGEVINVAPAVTPVAAPVKAK